MKKRITKRQLSETELAYLTDDDREIPEKGAEHYELWSLRHGFPPVFGDHGPRELWEENRTEFLPSYIQKYPCKRPLPWWQWEAPRRDTGTGAYFEPLPVPRERVGGKGETSWEKYPAVVPSFEKGIPSGWAWIDKGDPPSFESEAAFLHRHSLLTESEKKYLVSHPELMEPEKIEIEI
jgi:hypothetical protein